jgi:hypothetical protein
MTAYGVRPEVNAEQAAKRTMQGKRTQHGRLQGVGRDDQPNARERQVGCLGLGERFRSTAEAG